MSPPASQNPRRALLVASFVLVASTSGGAACTQADTVVSVLVRGNLPDIQQLQVTLTIADQMRTLMIPGAPRPISLPTSFTVQMDRSRQGALQVTVVALDGQGASLGQGNATLNRLAVGQTNFVQINLTSPSDPGPDGGADGGSPDGDDAGMPPPDSAGGSGGAGTGGAGTGGMGEGGGDGSGGSGSGEGGRGGSESGGSGAGGEATGGGGEGGDAGAAGGAGGGSAGAGGGAMGGTGGRATGGRGGAASGGRGGTGGRGGAGGN